MLLSGVFCFLPGCFPLFQGWIYFVSFVFFWSLLSFLSVSFTVFSFRVSFSSVRFRLLLVSFPFLFFPFRLDGYPDCVLREHSPPDPPCVSVPCKPPFGGTLHFILGTLNTATKCLEHFTISPRGRVISARELTSTRLPSVLAITIIWNGKTAAGTVNFGFHPASMGWNGGAMVAGSVTFGW